MLQAPAGLAKITTPTTPAKPARTAPPTLIARVRPPNFGMRRFHLSIRVPATRRVILRSDPKGRRAAIGLRLHASALTHRPRGGEGESGVERPNSAITSACHFGRYQDLARSADVRTARLRWRRLGVPKRRETSDDDDGSAANAPVARTRAGGRRERRPPPRPREELGAARLRAVESWTRLRVPRRRRLDAGGL